MSKVIAGACEKFLALITGESIQVCLFNNDHTPSLSDALDASDYTQPSGTGLDPVVLGSWADIATETGKATREHTVTWNPSGSLSGSVYGVYLRDYATGDLITGIRFAEPKLLVDGVPIVVDLKAIVKDPSVS